MLGTKAHPVEKFGIRVDWIIDNLELGKGTDSARNRTELWRLIAEADTLDVKKSEKTWKRCTGPKGDYDIPEVIIQRLLKLYPDLTREVLISERFDDFQKFALPIQEASARWVAATKYLAKNRGSLAALGKEYYQGVDERREFPLIAKNEWVLKKPVQLMETSPLPKWDPYVKEEQTHRLAGLNVDYHVIRSRLAPNGRKPTDNDSYRMLGVTPKDSGLEFTFGPTSYFPYINSLEATAVELADFARTHEQGAIPGFPDPRVPPNEIYNFKKRTAFAGVACILLLKNYFVAGHSDHRRRESNKFVLHERGELTTEAQNTINVVPAGGHQPLAKDFGLDREIAIWSTVVREFCEELFNKEDAARLRRHGENFLDLPEVKPLVDGVFRSGAAKIYLLGLGLDPVTTKPEILVAIVADWARASKKIVLKINEN